MSLHAYEDAREQRSTFPTICRIATHWSVEGNSRGANEQAMARTYPWKVSDKWWWQVETLIPATPSHAKGGRPRMPDRQAFAAIVYVLRTGIQWNALPRELGASSTVHDRFQEWERAGFFKALWRAGLEAYDEVQGI